MLQGHRIGGKTEQKPMRRINQTQEWAESLRLVLLKQCRRSCLRCLRWCSALDHDQGRGDVEKEKMLGDEANMKNCLSERKSKRDPFVLCNRHVIVL
ncbi:uncharacterized [Tachysurus ichikawai]